MKPVTLSLIIAAHHEELIAHKTMLSAERALKKLDEKGITYEIVVTIDNGNEETINYFKSYKKLPISLHLLTEGDLAESRNFAVKHSSGKYIATLDADDLVSENWFIAGLDKLKRDSKLEVLHTEYSINFGTQDIVWEKFDSRTKEEDALIMVWANRWDSAVLAPREVFERFPYQPDTEGYGSEDWHFNSQTLAADIPHVVVPETVLFVRRKDISEMTIQAADRRTLRYTDLLSIDFLKTIDVKPYEQVTQHPYSPNLNSLNTLRHKAKKAVKKAHKLAKNIPLYNSVTYPLLTKYKQSSTHNNARFPAWLIEEWKAIHTIEKGLFPSNDLLNSITLYHSEIYEPGIVFKNFMQGFSSEVDYIMFVPALWPGGAELVALNFIEALKTIHPEWHIAIVTTEPSENAWRNRIPEGVDFIDFGNATSHLDEATKLQLLARLIVQSKAKYLHIAQSGLMYRFTALYKTLLKKFTIYSFAFCEDMDDEGRVAGHIHSGLPGAYQAIDKIFTDHNAVINKLVNEYSFSKEKFRTHYQPVKLTLQPPHSSHTPLRILWASRITKQKRPDILKLIAEQLDPKKVHIDVYGIFENGFDENFFKGISALTYRGPFKSVQELHANEYDAFLYTSENDGIPNILLEMISYGLLIIAPNIGGIPELITDATGVLINPNDNIEQYVEEISLISKNYSTYNNRVIAAQKLVETRHSFENLTKQIKRDI